MESNTQVSLYEKLGGEEKITVLIDDIVEAHMNNPVIKARFIPYKEDPENLKTIKKRLVEFLCMGSGGPQEYHGRDMPTTHKGMNINEAEFMAATDDILGVLDQHGISEDAKNELLAILYSLKEEIMKV